MARRAVRAGDTPGSQSRWRLAERLPLSTRKWQGNNAAFNELLFGLKGTGKPRQIVAPLCSCSGWCSVPSAPCGSVGQARGLPWSRSGQRRRRRTLLERPSRVRPGRLRTWTMSQRRDRRCQRPRSARCGAAAVRLPAPRAIALNAAARALPPTAARCAPACGPPRADARPRRPAAHPRRCSSLSSSTWRRCRARRCTRRATCTATRSRTAW